MRPAEDEDGQRKHFHRRLARPTENSGATRAEMAVGTGGGFWEIFDGCLLEENLEILCTVSKRDLQGRSHWNSALSFLEAGDCIS